MYRSTDRDLVTQNDRTAVAASQGQRRRQLERQSAQRTGEANPGPAEARLRVDAPPQRPDSGAEC